MWYHSSYYYLQHHHQHQQQPTTRNSHSPLLSLILLLRLGPIRRTLDKARQVNDGKLKGKVEGGEHDGEENVPAQHAGNKRKGAGRDGVGVGIRHVARGRLRVSGRRGLCCFGERPVCACEQAEGGHEGQEDEEKDQVGSDGEHHVQEAQDTHEYEEEGCKEGFKLACGHRHFSSSVFAAL